MESMSIDPAAAAIGAQLVDAATRGVGSGAAALPSLTGLIPAGAEEVSMMAATAFGAEGQAMLAMNTAAQEELARAGMALTDIARMYSEVDGEAAGALLAGGARFAGQPIAGGLGGGLMSAETLAGAAAGAPLMANVTGAAAGLNPATTVPAAANAASMALGAGSAPLGAIGQVASIAQGASAGGSAGPGLASSLAADDRESGSDDAGDRQPGERLL